MTQTTSSAEYLKLYHYSDAALQLDNNLVGEANRLRGALLHFEATCRERAFRLSVAHVADGMVMYGARAAVVDAWVRVVGLDFQAADGGGLAALLPSWLPPWLLWPLPIQPSPEDRRPLKLLPVEPPSGPLWPAIPGLITLLPITLPSWLDRIFLWPGETGQQIPDPLGPVVVKPPTEDDNKGSSNDGETELGKLLRPPTKEALRQDQVEEGDPLLAAARYERDDNGNLVQERAWFGQIDTVRDHIKAYGCLMTSFTMLLRDLGKTTRVTDLYRANYKRKTGRSIEEDLAQDDDQNSNTEEDIVLKNLELDYNAIKDVTQNKYQAADGDNLFLSKPAYEPSTGNQVTDVLCSNLTKYGSVIIQVKVYDKAGKEIPKSFHWVVVDAYDSKSKTFTVRDPMSGQETAYGIPSGKYNPTGVVKYLAPM